MAATPPTETCENLSSVITLAVSRYMFSDTTSTHVHKSRGGAGCEGGGAASGEPASPAGSEKSCESCNEETARAAAAADALKKEQESQEHAFLDLAKVYDWIGLAEALKWNKKLVNVQPLGRWTALHQAARSGEKQVVEWLLGEGADPTKRTASGNTVMSLTTRRDIEELLMSAVGVDANCRQKKPAPTMVGGYLPKPEGGNDDDYYWPAPKYKWEQTFAYRRANPEARVCDIDCDHCRCIVLFFTRQYRKLCWQSRPASSR